MYGRIVLGIDGRRVRRAVRRRPRPRPARPTPTSRPTPSPSSATSTRRSSRSATGKPFPQDPTAQLRGAIEAVFRSWNGARADRLPRPRAHQPRPRHRGERPGDGVRQPRRQLRHRRRASPATPATGENRPYGDFLVNAQGEDVVAGIRNTEALDRARPTSSPTIYDELLDIFDRLERALPRHAATPSSPSSRASSGCSRRASASAPGAAALRMAVDMTKRPRHQAHARGGRAARHRRAPRPGAAPAVRARPTCRCSPTGLAASPGAAVGQGVLRRRRRRRRRRPRREGHPRAQRDLARGRRTACRWPRASSPPRRPREPRRGRRPRLGHPRRGRRRGRRASTATAFTVGDIVVREGDVISLDGTTGRGHARRGRS